HRPRPWTRRRRDRRSAAGRHRHERGVHPQAVRRLARLHDKAVNVEQFLYYEARLLDTQQLEAWLELFTEDATYWLPLEMGQKDPVETSSIVYDDRTLLELRVKQARHPRAHARLPLARTVHTVSNVMPLEEKNGELRVGSTLQVIEFRNERQRLY